MKVYLLGVGVLLFAACAPPTNTQSTNGDAVSTGTGAIQEAAMPETNAQAVWQYLQAQSFEDWPLLPGTERFYGGTAPHGALLTTYVNTVAQEAITNEASSLPAGSILVKQNYTPDRTLAATTVMYKVNGYDASHDDWYWMKRLANETVEAEGKVESCQNCHRTAAGNDYVFQ